MDLFEIGHQNDAILKTIIYIFLMHTLFEEFLFFYFFVHNLNV